MNPTLQELQAQLNVLNLQLASINANFTYACAQNALQNSKTLANINNQIATVNSQITALQTVPVA